MLPARSASEMKTSGGTIPSSGCCQRSSDSKPTIRPVNKSNEAVDSGRGIEPNRGGQSPPPDEQMPHHLRPLLGVEERDRGVRLLVVLGSVHRGVRVGEQLACRLWRFANDDADARGHREPILPHRERLLERPAAGAARTARGARAATRVLTTANSSPPRRTMRSSARTTSISRCAALRSTSSPTTWPWLSLMNLKSLRSSTAGAIGHWRGSESAIARRSIIDSRLARPVSASRRSSASRFSSRWRSSPTSCWRSREVEYWRTISAAAISIAGRICRSGMPVAFDQCLGT